MMQMIWIKVDEEPEPEVVEVEMGATTTVFHFQKAIINALGLSVKPKDVKISTTGGKPLSQDVSLNTLNGVGTKENPFIVELPFRTGRK